MANGTFINTLQLQTFTESQQIPFKHVEIIGNGGVGVVEEVTGSSQAFSGGKFARKTIKLHETPVDRATQIRELNNEVAILKKFQHKHIVQLIMAYMFRDSYAIVMDPRADRDLERHLQTANNPMGDLGEKARDQIPKWIKCLISGLAHIHEQGVRHRDIKPSNILLQGDNILFADFGISMMGLGTTVPTTAPEATSRLHRGRTPEYCAPEVELGHSRGRSADIFSLGAVILEMVTVHSNPGRLEQFRNELQVGDRRSYAKNVPKALQWIDSLKGAQYYPLWQSNILFLCQKTLQEDRYQRPKAADLCMWWSRQSAFLMPPVSCGCNPLSEESEHTQPASINDELRKCYKRGYRLMIDFLISKGATISDADTLLAASEGGLHDVVQSLIDGGVSIEVTDNTGRTPLSWAAEKGRESIVKFLIECGAVAETRDGSRRTPLSWAAEKGQEAVVSFLIERNVDIDSKDSSERTALSWASGKGQRAIVMLLLNKRAGIETKDRLGLTPLAWAAGQGQEITASLLIDRRAYIESQDTFGRTPLSWAAEEGQEAVIKLLLGRRARVNAQDYTLRTPLSWAAERGQEAAIRLLLDSKAEIEARDSSKRTPLSWAAWRGQEAAVKLLLDKGADRDAKDISGWTPLSLAAEEGYLSTAKLLLNTENIDARDGSGRTALSSAAEKGLAMTVKLLLENKADIDAKDSSGRTPLSWTAEKGPEAMVKVLLQRKAKIDAKDNSRRTPLSWAAEEGRASIVKLLLDQGAKIEPRDKHGWTPLTRAVEKGHEEMVRLLLERGAKVERPAYLDWSPSA